MYFWSVKLFFLQIYTEKLCEYLNFNLYSKSALTSAIVQWLILILWIFFMIIKCFFYYKIDLWFFNFILLLKNNAYFKINNFKKLMYILHLRSKLIPIWLKKKQSLKANAKVYHLAFLIIYLRIEKSQSSVNWN